jgi:tartrate dehydratase beta subunit/fumarate hydratase class I family protein
MNKNEFAKEVGMVASIMADHVSQRLYKHMQDNGSGYIATHEQIAEWAVEFVLKHENTNWEDLLESSMKPLSKEMNSIICWDDGCIDYAYYKLEKLKR